MARDGILAVFELNIQGESKDVRGAGTCLAFPLVFLLFLGAFYPVLVLGPGWTNTSGGIVTVMRVPLAGAVSVSSFQPKAIMRSPAVAKPKAVRLAWDRSTFSRSKPEP